MKVSAADTRDVRVEFDKIGLNYDRNRAAVSALSDNKEAAIRFLDKMYDPEVGIQILWGGMNDVDKCIAKNADGSYTILPPADTKMDWGTWKWTSSWADLGPIYISDDMTINMGKDMVDTLAQRAAYDSYVAKVNLKQDMYCDMYMKFSDDDQSTMGVNQANINNVALPTMVAWITGSQDVNAEWDAYIQSLNASGLAENLAIKQAAYDIWLTTLK
jgi:putative aldouronate transport system substrate-binding protein